MYRVKCDRKVQRVELCAGGTKTPEGDCRRRNKVHSSIPGEVARYIQEHWQSCMGAQGSESEGREWRWDEPRCYGCT